MPNPNVMAGASRIRHALKALQEHWMTTQETWNDSARARFEDRHLKPLDPATDAALIGMQKFAEVIDRVRRDCSDRSEPK